METKLLAGLPLAYIGDSVYELYIRKYFVLSGLSHVNDLHKTVIKYTCAEHQSKVIKYLIENNILDEEELLFFKRGRNSGANKTRKTLSQEDYNNATGFESLIGHLYFKNNLARIEEITNISLSMKE